MKQRELTLLKNPQLKYLPAYILKDTESFFARYETMASEKRNEMLSGYKMLQDFVRRFVKAGGKIHSGSDPNHVVPGYAVHAELQMLVEAGLTPLQAISTASINVAQAWGKEKDYGSIEKGKVADVIIVRGDPTKSISDTQNVEMVFIDGKKMDTSFHADYKNPMPRPIEDRPESERRCYCKYGRRLSNFFDRASCVYPRSLVGEGKGEGNSKRGSTLTIHCHRTLPRKREKVLRVSC